MARIPVRLPRDPNDFRAGNLFFDTDSNKLIIYSDATFQDIAEKLPEGWVNVKDFGAKGDGITDDTQAFQDALNTGKNVFVPAGNYLITNRLVPQSNQIISGVGSKSVLMSAGNRILEILYKNTVRVENLKFTTQNFSKTLRTNTPEIILCSRAYHIIIRNCVFENINGTSLYLANTKITIENNKFINAGLCYLRMDAGYYVIRNNYLYADTDFENDYFFLALNGQYIFDSNYSENCAVGSTSTATPGTFGITYFLFRGEYIVTKAIDINPRWSNLLFGSDTLRGILTQSYLIIPQANRHTIWIEQSNAKEVIVRGNVLYGGMHMGENGGDKVIISDNIIILENDFIDVSSGTKNLIFTNNYIEYLTTYENRAVYVWNHNNPKYKAIFSNNIINNALKFIYANNGYGTGTVYNLIITNNIITHPSSKPLIFDKPDTVSTSNVIVANNIEQISSEW